MTKEKALEIMSLAVGGKCGELSIHDIELHNNPDYVIIFWNDNANGLKIYLYYHLDDILEFSVSPIGRDWEEEPVEICNATKVIRLLGEWKAGK